MSVSSPEPPLPPQPERLVMRKDEATRKNASLFTCDLIIFCRVSLYIKKTVFRIRIQLKILMRMRIRMGGKG
jgi:hypothetical protein